MCDKQVAVYSRKVGQFSKFTEFSKRGAAMSDKKINVVILPNGEVSFEMENFQGRTCLDGSAFLEQALGAVENRKKLASFYQEAKQDNKTKVNNY